MGITPVNPEQACPWQEHLFNAEPTLVISLIAANQTITFLFSECLLELDELPPVRQEPLQVLGFILQTTCEGSPQLSPLFRNNLQDNSQSEFQN